MCNPAVVVNGQFDLLLGVAVQWDDTCDDIAGRHLAHSAIRAQRNARAVLTCIPTNTGDSALADPSPLRSSVPLHRVSNS